MLGFTPTVGCVLFKICKSFPDEAQDSRDFEHDTTYTMLRFIAVLSLPKSVCFIVVCFDVGLGNTVCETMHAACHGAATDSTLSLVWILSYPEDPSPTDPRDDRA